MTGSYLRSLETRNLRPTYIYNQSLTLGRLRRHIGGCLTTATPDLLDLYVVSRCDISPGALAVEIAHIRGFYRWALNHDWIPFDPTRRLVKPRIPRRLPRPMPDHLIRDAIAGAPEKVRLILYLAVYAGLRSCEIAQLRAEDLADGIIVVRESKGGHTSTVPIAPPLAELLATINLPRAGWLFPNRATGHLSRSRVGQLANRYLAGLDNPHRLHSLRHAYGTHLYRATRDLRVTQELLRHRSPTTTALYTDVVDDERVAALAHLPHFAAAG